MLLKKLKRKQSLENYILACNNVSLQLLCSMPILAANTFICGLVKDGIIHFSSQCNKNLKREKYFCKNDSRPEIELKLLTNQYLQKQNLTICEKCLRWQSITGGVEKVKASDKINDWQADALTEIFEDIFFLNDRLHAAKECDLVNHQVENIQKVLESYRKIKTACDYLHANSALYFSFIADNSEEKIFFETLLKEAEAFNNKAAVMLQSTESKKAVFAALAETALPFQKNSDMPIETTVDMEEKVVLYGLKSLDRHSDYLQQVLESVSIKISFPKEKLITCYDLMKLSIFINQDLDFNEPDHFAINVPRNAGDLILDTSVLGLMPALQFMYMLPFPNSEKSDEETLKTAYVLWEASGFTIPSYEKALNAALLLKV